jgi:hypothetical protein
VRVLACLALAASLLSVAGTTAGGAVAHAFCPGIAGALTYPKAGKLHRLELRECTDRVVGTAATETGAVPGVRTNGARERVQKIWVHGRLVFSHAEDGPVITLRLSADGRWLFFVVDPQASGSIAADGLDLLVVSTRGGHVHHLGKTLVYRDYLAWCDGRLVYAQGSDRIAIHAKRLLVAAPPDWRPRPLWPGSTRSFASPACDPSGRSVAVLVQRSGDDASFFDTRWQLWRVGLDGSRALLDRPPPGYADESPSWSPDGGELAFVRERMGHGQIAVLVGTDLYGPLAELGYSLGYYGHHDWRIGWQQ